MRRPWQNDRTWPIASAGVTVTAAARTPKADCADAIAGFHCMHDYSEHWGRASNS